MLKLLIILRNNFPYPLNSGGQKAVFHMIDNLRKYIDITLVCWGGEVNPNDAKYLYERWKDVSIKLIYPCPKRKLPHYVFYKKAIKKITALLWHNNFDYKKDEAFNVESDYEAYYLKEIDNIIRNSKYDIIQTEFAPAMNLVYFLPKETYRIFIQHEIIHIKNSQYLSFMPVNTISDNLKLNKLRVEEISAMNQYDMVIALTETDKLKLEQMGVKSQLEYSPASIGFTQELENADSYNFKNEISFLGGYTHTPNKDGIFWFLDNIWPRMLKKYPNLKFSVIGNWPLTIQKEIQKKYSHIEFLGFVEDLKEALNYSIMIVPIRIGGGMRMKILEASNLGIPFITTSLGVEGLNFKHNKDCIIADSIDDFSDGISKLIEDTSLRTTIRKNSYYTFTREYSAEVLSEKRLKIYQSIKK